MSDSMIGVGRIRVEMNLGGLDEDDLAAIDSVLPLISLPSGELIEFDGDVDMAMLLTERKVYFIYEFLEEGRYLLGAKLSFVDGLYATTYRNDSFVVTDAFGGNGGPQ